MARPRMTPGSWGAITIRPTESGTYVARARYRRTDGKHFETEVRGKSKSAAQNLLILNVNGQSELPMGGQPASRAGSIDQRISRSRSGAST